MSAAAHGHTPAAWTGVSIAFIGFCVSGIGMILPSTWNVLTFWVGVVIVVAGGVIGRAMSMAGLGKQPSPHYATAVEADERTPVAAA